MLFISHERCLDHLAGSSHPESPDRLTSIAEGLDRAEVGKAVTMLEAPMASIKELAPVHPESLIKELERLTSSGGGKVDTDTVATKWSFEAALYAAGAGLAAIEQLRQGRDSVAFCAVRPPGHHATSDRSMGFCLFNNIAVTATALAESGERVAIVDYDAHHGNGTQDIFYSDDRVLFASIHQWPCYPGTGRLEETGSGNGLGSTINVALPPGATGDVYTHAWERVISPKISAFDPTWLLVSAGFDAHRDDPLTAMGLSAGDYAALTKRVMQAAPNGQVIIFLEGGYNLSALAEASAAVFAVLAGTQYQTEPLTYGGPGIEAVDAAVKVHRLSE